MRPLVKNALLMALLLSLAAGGYLFRPNPNQVTPYPQFEKVLPEQVGEWTYVPAKVNTDSYVSISTDTSLEQPYNEVSMRTYYRLGHSPMMLALAWGQRQRQEVKIHNPVLCYKASGHQVLEQRTTTLDSVKTGEGALVVHQMLTKSIGGYEVVSYWIRIGHSYSEGSVATRLAIVKDGLQGIVPDGVLVRASVRVASPSEAPKAYSETAQFLKQFYQDVQPETKSYLVL